MNTPTVSSAQILPSGNILLVQFDSPVASVGNANLTLTVGSKTIALPLATGMWRNNTTFLWFPLNFNYAAVIDDAVATKTGSWGSNPNTTGMFAGNAYAISAHGGGDPSTYPTITYPFANVPAGNYKVYVNPTVWPDFTPDAKYVVKDGDTIDGVFHVNQKAKPSYDHLHRGLHYQLLGTVSCASGNLFVTLTDADDTGYAMGSDAVLIERVQGRTVPVGTAVTLDAPDGWVVTRAGPVAGAVARPVTLETDATWFPFDPDAPRTMTEGYNIGFPQYPYPDFLYANRYRSAGEWHGGGVPGTFALDADGHLANLSGGAAAMVEFLALYPNGRDFSSFPCARRSGTWRFFYSYAGATPTLSLVDTTQKGFLLGPVTTVSSTVANGRTEVWATATIDTGPETVNQPAGRYYNASVGLQVSGNAIGPDLQILDPDTPEGWTSKFHPSIFRMLKGKGFDSLRFMDAAQVINSNVVEFDDFPTESTQSTLGYRKQIGATVVAFDPVVFDGVDPDGITAQSWFGREPGWAIVKVTTSTPHAVTPGRQVAFIGPDAGGVWPDNGGGAINSQNSNYSVPLTDTTFLCRMYAPGQGGAANNVNPFTLAARATPALTSAVRIGQGMPPIDQVLLSNDVNVAPWIHIHHLMSDAAVTSLFTLVAKNLSPALRCRVEFSNEVWDTIFAQTYHFAAWARRAGWLKDHGMPGGFVSTGSPDRSGFAHRFVEVMRLARAAFVAAGRPATDLVRVLGSQRGNPGNTEWAVQQFDYEQHSAFWGEEDPFDETAIDTYQDNDASYDDPYFGPVDDGKNNAAFDALDGDSAIDLMKLHLSDGHFEAQVAGHVFAMTAHHFARKPIVAYEGGFGRFVPYGSNVDDRNRRSQAAARLPRARLLELSRKQDNIQSAGISHQCRFTLNEQGGDDTGNEWHNFIAIYQPVGLGDGSDGLYDNRKNPHDLEHVVSVLGLATEQWGGTVAPPPPPPPPAKPGPPGLSRKRPPAKPRGGL